MRHLLSVLAVSAVVGLATACAPAAPGPHHGGPDVGHGMTTVRVTATYRERILLTPGHVLTVRIEDVSLADAPARVLAEHTETLTGNGPPYSATLGFPSSQIDPRHTYAARAEIRDPSGRLRFVTDTHYPILTRGAGAQADIVLVAAR